MVWNIQKCQKNSKSGKRPQSLFAAVDIKAVRSALTNTGETDEDVAAPIETSPESTARRLGVEIPQPRFSSANRYSARIVYHKGKIICSLFFHSRVAGYEFFIDLNIYKKRKPTWLVSREWQSANLPMGQRTWDGDGDQARKVLLTTRSITRFHRMASNELSSVFRTRSGTRSPEARSERRSDRR